MNFETWVRRGVDRLHRMPYAPQDAFEDRRVGAAARLLCLPHAGIDVREESIAAVTLDMARVAEEYGLAPDELNQFLCDHEPRLKEGLQHE